MHCNFRNWNFTFANWWNFYHIKTILPFWNILCIIIERAIEQRAKEQLKMLSHQFRTLIISIQFHTNYDAITKSQNNFCNFLTKRYRMRKLNSQATRGPKDRNLFVFTSKIFSAKWLCFPSTETVVSVELNSLHGICRWLKPISFSGWWLCGKCYCTYVCTQLKCSKRKSKFSQQFSDLNNKSIKENSIIKKTASANFGQTIDYYYHIMLKKIGNISAVKYFKMF